MAELNETSRANRLHIGVFGRRNAGKSSLINLITGHDTALVSEFAGTTTDPVYKSIELHGIGPCVLIDTPGFDDEGALGALRVERTQNAMDKADIALMVISADSTDTSIEETWISRFKEKKTPILGVITKTDLADAATMESRMRDILKIPYIVIPKAHEEVPHLIRKAVLRLIPEDFEQRSLTAGLVNQGDVVLLVMPQDIQAPKGRLILPQVQTIRDLLDHKALVISCTTDNFSAALACLNAPPALIITDSQVFPFVYENKPKESRLTSFSVLMAGLKGDIEALAHGASVISSLTDKSRILIAEACTHAPLTEDIGRVKIPRMLKKRFGEGITIDMVSGSDFPSDLSSYDLIIHCGGCMFNRKYFLSRQEAAKNAGVPMTNYGVFIAAFNGILDKISF
ncbi:MAG: [Clostridia bacterium]|nr:[FeFe] hydrogenase H-cluster maturation GTPase HydF [Clostridia bacterium]